MRQEVCWRVPADATPASARDEVIEAHGGIVRPFERGSFTFENGRVGYWTRGAAHYADGRVIEQSKRIGGIAGDATLSIDQGWVQPSRSPNEVAGAAYFVGPWMAHFGHFLLETVPMLWSLQAAVPVLFLPTGGPPPVQYELDLLRYAGLEAPLVPVETETRVEELLVPSRPVALNGWVSPAAARLWARMGDRAAAEQPATPSARRVWLSRSRAELDERKVKRRIGGSALDEAFATRGFDVVYPEDLTIGEQIRMARAADVLAGFEGSALHLSAFAGKGARVLMLGSERRPNGNRTQATIDAAVGNRHAAVAHGDQASMLRQVDALLESASLERR